MHGQIVGAIDQYMPLTSQLGCDCDDLQVACHKYYGPDEYAAFGTS